MSTRSLSRKILYTTILVGIFLIILLGIGEIFLRLFKPLPNNSYYFGKSIPDQKIGWVSIPNLNEEFRMKDWQSDSSYQVTYTTTNEGFRSYGDIFTNKPKIFFVGDSYTQSAEVNIDQTFYSIIGDSLNVEVFAYGQAGYGSLQELFIIEENINIINPDLVVLQVCDNDFIDNYPPLETNSIYRVGERRPYYQRDGSINYFIAGKARWQITTDKSRILRAITYKLKQVIFKYNGRSSQELMSTKGREYRKYDEAVDITGLIFNRLSETIGETPLLIFSASNYEPMLSDMKAIAKENNILLIDGPGKIIDENKFQKPPINSSDGYHWNRHGQVLVADTLIPSIKQEIFNR